MRLRHAGAVLRREPVGGAVLLVATVIAVVWANSPLAGAYEALQDTRVGPSALHLDLTLQSWTADGLLAVFFFVVGLELKREFVEGDLRDPRHALVPIAGAVGGVAAPALVYVLVTSVAGSDALNGWAVPAATDIAFAVAVFAVLGRGLPPALRLFLLTLAVVDDLLAITIIAFAYTAELNVVFLALAALPLAAFALLLRRGVTRLWVLLPLGVVVWALVHESGVHATVAGVALGLAVPAGALAARFEHAWQPWSMGVAVPAFALLSAGVALGGASGLGDALTDGVVLAVIAGLVVGKPLGILGATWITARLTAARLDASLRWADIAAVATLSGIGFTVSLLVGEIAFGADGERLDHVKIGVLCGSAVAAILGGLLLRRRARRVGG